MKVILCIDKSDGMAFLGMRQSRDRVLTQDIINDLGGEKLYIHPKTLKVFEKFDNSFLEVTEAPLADCDGVCFLELESPKAELARVDTLVIYHWNREYPSDVKLGFEPREEGFRCISTSSFKGYSHKKITKEIWVKK